MPHLNVRVSSPLPATEFDAAVGQLAAGLSNLAAELLEKKHALTAVSIQHIEPSRWLFGGQALAEQGTSSFFHEIKVTEGTNTKDEKAAYVRAVYGLFERALVPLHPAS